MCGVESAAECGVSYCSMVSSVVSLWHVFTTTVKYSQYLYKYPARVGRWYGYHSGQYAVTQVSAHLSTRLW